MNTTHPYPDLCLHPRLWNTQRPDPTRSTWDTPDDQEMARRANRLDSIFNMSTDWLWDLTQSHDGRWIAMSNHRHTIESLVKQDRYDLIQTCLNGPEPALTPHPWFNALVAGYVECICIDHGLMPPAWINSPARFSPTKITSINPVNPHETDLGPERFASHELYQQIQAKIFQHHRHLDTYYPWLTRRNLYIHPDTFRVV